jgi:hypothetical protein
MRQKFVDWEKPTFCESSIEAASRMSLAQNKPIATGILRMPRIYIESTAIKHGKNIRAGEDSADMRSASSVGHMKSMYADPLSQLLAVDF